MVSTRNHPKAFPPPTASPSKTTRSSSVETPSPSRGSFERRSAGLQVWSHTPSNLSLIWLIVSLPLVIWDTGYVFLRPHSMAGGKLHWPIWKPYELYATVDYVYGWPSYDSHNGFTAAQASLNVVETIGYIFYLWILYSRGSQEDTLDGRGAPASKSVGWLGLSREVKGKWAAYAVLILYGTSLMTVSKTILYWLNEAFSGFASIGHNDIGSLTFLWIVPNGLWIVVPTYMIYISGVEILQGLEIATARETKKER